MLDTYGGTTESLQPASMHSSLRKSLLDFARPVCMIAVGILVAISVHG
jgi:hypothetical protein